MELSQAEAISQRITQLLNQRREQAGGAFGDQLHIAFRGYDPARQEYILSARTEGWMRNIDGVVHGGFCAALADHAMGVVAFCLKEGDRVAPTIQLQISYHRPLPPEEEVVIRVRPLSVTSRLLNLSAEVARTQKPETPCFTAAATYFVKDA